MLGQNNKFSVGLRATGQHNFHEIGRYYGDVFYGEGNAVFPKYQAGVNFQYNFNKFHSLRIGLTGSKIGHKSYDGIDPFYGFVRPNRLNDIFIYTIDIPIDYKFNYFSSRNVVLFINGGPELGIPFSQISVSHAYNGDTQKSRSENLDHLNSPFLSVNIGVGAMFLLGKTISLELNPFFNYELNQKYKNLITKKPYGIGGTMAINYRFIKNNGIHKK